MIECPWCGENVYIVDNVCPSCKHEVLLDEMGEVTFVDPASSEEEVFVDLEYEIARMSVLVDSWFTVEQMDPTTFAISEYGHWENGAMTVERVTEIMLKNPRTLHDLSIVQTLKLPQWCIAAGYVRNQVWDYLHGNEPSASFHDVDVIYYDPNDLREEIEKTYEQQLRSYDSTLNWSVKNQARMHLRNGAAPYQDVEDAMKRWPETATAVGITLNASNEMEVIAPLGVEDLFGLKLRQSPFYDNTDFFLQRVSEKGWLTRYPKLSLIKE